MKDFKRVWKMLFMVGIVITMTLALTVAAKAAPSKVTGVRQTDHGKNSIDLEWDALLDNNVRYEVSVSTDKKIG